MGLEDRRKTPPPLPATTRDNGQVHVRGRPPSWKSALALIVLGSVIGVALWIAADLPRTSPTELSSQSASVLATRAVTLAQRTAAQAGASSAGAAPSDQPPKDAGASTAAATGHVWWILMENKEYGTIVGSPAAPYFNRLVVRYGLATRYYATSHPSEPNYVALVAGATLGVTSDGVYHLTKPSLFSQLADAGRTWRVYAQNDRSGCFSGTIVRGGRDGPGAAGTYARKHNPAITFRSVSDTPSQCQNIQPLRAFDPGAAPFEMIVPNLTNDMHDGSIGQGDAFLKALVPRITGSAAFRAGGVLFITFDEGTSHRGSLGDHGGHVATLIIAASVTPGFRFRSYADHWTLLRTTERILGLPCLAGACRRSPIDY